MNNFQSRKHLIIPIRILAFVLAGIIVLLSVPVSKSQADDSSSRNVNIIFTHDLHSYLSSFNAYHEGNVQEIGGMARLSTFLKQTRAERENVLVLDGGDLAMGTLYQTLYATDALELKMLGMLGFDATTFGNHDFDYSSDKLVDMFNSAAAAEDIVLPAFTVCNIDWEQDNADTKAIKNAADKCNLCEYTVVEKGDVRIAVIGLFGKSATNDSPTLNLVVKDQIESIKATIDKIKSNEKVDMLVCISHSGTSEKYADSEDEILAKAVPELDVIISAHSHTVLQTPIVYGDTYIMGCGCYGEYTGFSSLSQKSDGRWKLDEYKLVPMNSDIEEDKEIVDLLAEYNEIIENQYLKQFDLKIDQVLAVNDYNFETVDDMYFDYSEHNLGNLMSDAYRYAVNNTQSGKENPVQISVVPSGTVRGSFFKGNITTADAFQCYSLGMGYDEEVGFPLVNFYVLGSEVKMIPEIDASLSPLMNTANLYCSGLSYSVGTKRMFLNKAYNIVLNPDVMCEDAVTIEDDKLYSVVTDLYTARMLGSVSRLSKGLIKIYPKYSDGTILESDDKDYIWENVVVYEDDGSELKTWYAIATYLQSFEKNSDGISVVPKYYSEYHGRKIVNDNFSFKILMTQTNKYFWMICGVVAGIIVVLTVVILSVINAVRKKKMKTSSTNETADI